MVNNDKFAADLKTLEYLLVKQFRTLQRLTDLTKKERENLLNNDADALMRLVEEKEAMLDQMGLIEDDRRKQVQSLALQLNIHSEETSVSELLPYLHKVEAERLKRLSEGVTTLANQARDLNYGNQALAYSRIDWLKAVQGFIVRTTQPEAGYRPPGINPGHQESVALGWEYRA